MRSSRATIYALPAISAPPVVWVKTLEGKRGAAREDAEVMYESIAAGEGFEVTARSSGTRHSEETGIPHR